jgi:hypothetical protein
LSSSLYSFSWTFLMAYSQTKFLLQTCQANVYQLGLYSVFCLNTFVISLVSFMGIPYSVKISYHTFLSVIGFRKDLPSFLNVFYFGLRSVISYLDCVQIFVLKKALFLIFVLSHSIISIIISIISITTKEYILSSKQVIVWICWDCLAIFLQVVSFVLEIIIRFIVGVSFGHTL